MQTVFFAAVNYAGMIICSNTDTRKLSVEMKKRVCYNEKREIGDCPDLSRYRQLFLHFFPG